jgi:hypothetical protein
MQTEKIQGIYRKKTARKSRQEAVLGLNICSSSGLVLASRLKKFPYPSQANNYVD